MTSADQTKDLAPWEEASAEETKVIPEYYDADSGEDDAPIPPEKVILADEIASEYVGFWNRLISQTNWEKGKVILTWRNRLIEGGLPRKAYSDDNIARRIGNVSGQHVGRLRRVFERFGSEERLANLFWSHYQAALDWEDAGDWLKKANDENLSVASMRISRWEKYGAPPEKKPKDNEIVASEPDEDVNPHNDSDADFIDVGDNFDAEDKKSKKNSKHDKSDSENESLNGESGLNGDSNGTGSPMDLNNFRGDEETWQGATTSGVLNSLNKLPSLPDDMADAFEMLKISILNHKLTSWDLVSADTVLSYISAMRGLVLSSEK